MKNLFLLWAFLLISICSIAQPYGNEWIDYGKNYYKFESTHEGLIQISYETLVASGIDLVGANFKLISGGEEQAIYVSTDGVFQTGDYLEFYGSPNDGKYDTQLFESSAHQLQDKTSLFSDVRSYFLVSDGSGANLRYETVVNAVVGDESPEPYFWHTESVVLDFAFHFGEPYLKEIPNQGIYQFSGKFSEGEGWAGGIVKETIDPNTGENIGQVQKVPTYGLYTEGPQTAFYETTVVGRTNSDYVQFDEFINIQLGNTAFVVDSFKDFSVKRYDVELPIDSIATELDFVGKPETRFEYIAFDGVSSETAEVYSWENGETDTADAIIETITDLEYTTKFSLAEHQLTYPHNFDFQNKKSFVFELEIDTEKYFEVSNFDGGTSPVLYDLTTHHRLLPILASDGGEVIYQFKVQTVGGSTTRKFYLSHATDDAVVANVSSLTERVFTDFAQITEQGDYLIVTHDTLRLGAIDEVDRYREYRESVAGGDHLVSVIEINELYEQFAQGVDQHPMAIQNFLRFAIEQFSIAPKYLNLLGKGIQYDKIRGNAINRANSLVPSFGYFASDFWLVNIGGNNDFSPQINVGRIPALTGNDVKAYLDKLIEYESQGNACEGLPDWKKDFLMLSKGEDEAETTAIFERQEVWGDTLESAGLGLNQVAHLTDFTGPIPPELTNSYQTQLSLPNLIEEGVGLISYVGYASPSENYWQFDMQEPSFYNNEGKYPIIMSNSSFTGAVFNPLIGPSTMASDYILAENRGAIAYFASQWFNYLQSDYNYSEQYDVFQKAALKKILENNQTGSIAENIRLTILELYPNANFDLERILEEFVFIGDPALYFGGIQPNIDCANVDLPVWPGDIGYDSIANNLDVVYLGMQYGEIGAFRPDANLNWEAQPMSDWTTWQNNGANTKHADCDGNGVVDAADLIAIDQNYRLTHELGKTAQMGVPLNLFLPDTIFAGDSIDIFIQLGTLDEQIEDFYGIAFTIEFNPEYIKEGSIQFDFDSDFLGQEEEDVIGLGKVFHDEGIAEIGISKIDMENEDGDGFIGKMSVVMIEDIIGKEDIVVPLTFTTTAITALSLNGDFLEVGSETVESKLIGETSTAIASVMLVNEEVSLYPNPVESLLQIENTNQVIQRVELINQLGKVILQKDFERVNTCQLDFGFVQNGQYFVKVYLEKETIIKNIVKLK